MRLLPRIFRSLACSDFGTEVTAIKRYTIIAGVNGFAEKAEYKNGVLILKSGDIPDWIEKLRDYLQNNC